MKNFHIKFIDEGFCRVVYKTKTRSGNELLYCLQCEGHNSVVFYRCTDDIDYAEPMYPVNPTVLMSIEKPEGNSDVINQINNYIENHKLLLPFKNQQDNCNDEG